MVFFNINQICTTEHCKYVQVQNQDFLAYGIEISFVQPYALLITDKLAFSSRRIVLLCYDFYFNFQLSFMFSTE